MTLSFCRFIRALLANKLFCRDSSDPSTKLIEPLFAYTIVLDPSNRENFREFHDTLFLTVTFMLGIKGFEVHIFICLFVPPKIIKHVASTSRRNSPAESNSSVHIRIISCILHIVSLCTGDMNSIN